MNGTTRVAIASLILVAGAALSLAQPTSNSPAPQPPPPPTSASAPARTDSVQSSEQPRDARQEARNEQAAHQPPKIVVHRGQTPATTADRRVSVGGTYVSMPPNWGPAESAARTEVAASPVIISEPVRIDGAIAVPANTLGPGEALWQRNERLSAEIKLAHAQADYARTLADRAEALQHDNRWRGGYRRHGTFLAGGYTFGGGAGRNDGLRGPVTTTTTYSDFLGSTAQRAYAEAAYPRLNGSQDARDAAVRQFGRDATPPIIRIQNDVDRAHNNANKER